MKALWVACKEYSLAIMYGASAETMLFVCATGSLRKASTSIRMYACKPVLYGSSRSRKRCCYGCRCMRLSW